MTSSAAVLNSSKQITCVLLHHSFATQIVCPSTLQFTPVCFEAGQQVSKTSALSPGNQPAGLVRTLQQMALENQAGPSVRREPFCTVSSSALPIVGPQPSKPLVPESGHFNLVTGAFEGRAGKVLITLSATEKPSWHMELIILSFLFCLLPVLSRNVMQLLCSCQNRAPFCYQTRFLFLCVHGRVQRQSVLKSLDAVPRREGQSKKAFNFLLVRKLDTAEKHLRTNKLKVG